MRIGDVASVPWMISRPLSSQRWLLRISACTNRADGVFARRITLQQRFDIARVRAANTDRLRGIVAEIGWPGRMLVGEDGAEHAWLIAQHADHQLDSQRVFLDALAVDAGDAPARHPAFLTDRVSANEGMAGHRRMGRKSRIWRMGRRSRGPSRNQIELTSDA